MLLLTTEVLPENCVIEEMFPMVYSRATIEVSSKGLIRGYMERNKNETSEQLDSLASLAPSDANAIIGIKVTTTTHQFGNIVYLFNTFIGTPIRFRNKDVLERRKT